VSVKEIIQGLEALQGVDMQVTELQRAGEVYPRRLAELDAELAAARSALEMERTRLTESEKSRREKEAEIGSENDKIKKWEARLADMRTTREYAALAREIDIAKKNVSNLEEEQKSLAEQSLAIRKTLEDRERELLRKEDGSAAERADLSEKIGSLANQVRELQEKRSQLAMHTDPELTARYDFVRKKRGTGIATVTNGICKGCNMRLPPQFQNILRSGSTIETCPSCQRLIYASEIL
jgi:hypothetical protein